MGVVKDGSIHRPSGIAQIVVLQRIALTNLRKAAQGILRPQGRERFIKPGEMYSETKKLQDLALKFLRYTSLQSLWWHASMMKCYTLQGQISFPWCNHASTRSFYKFTRHILLSYFSTLDRASPKKYMVKLLDFTFISKLLEIFLVLPSSCAYFRFKFSSYQISVRLPLSDYLWYYSYLCNVINSLTAL